MLALGCRELVLSTSLYPTSAPHKAERPSGRCHAQSCHLLSRHWRLGEFPLKDLPEAVLQLACMCIWMHTLDS